MTVLQIIILQIKANKFREQIRNAMQLYDFNEHFGVV